MLYSFQLRIQPSLKKQLSRPNCRSAGRYAPTGPGRGNSSNWGIWNGAVDRRGDRNRNSVDYLSHLQPQTAVHFRLFATDQHKSVTMMVLDIFTDKYMWCELIFSLSESILCWTNCPCKYIKCICLEEGSVCTCLSKKDLSSRVSSTSPLTLDLHSLSPGRAAYTWRSLCLQRAGRKQAPNLPVLRQQRNTPSAPLPELVV